MTLSYSDIEHLAKLARMELTSDEIETFGSQLSSVLRYVGQLQEVDTEGVEVGYQVQGLSNATAKDTACPADDTTRARMLDAFPDRAGDLLRVKSVFE